MTLSRQVPAVLVALLAACSARQPVPTPQEVAAAPALAPEQVRPEQRVSPRLRLPESVRPTGYAVELTFDPASPAFHGRLEAGLAVRAPTDVVWLHGKRLAVKEASLVQGGVAIPLMPLKGEADFLGFALGHPLAVGEATLRIAYEGEASERELDGAFRVKEGADWYVYTQFEPLGARAVFPCFDEPGFKVPWQLTFHVPAGNTVVTNTPPLSEEEGAGGLRTVRFTRTQPMPSYLVAFGVGPFDFLEAAASGQKQVRTRIVTPRGRAAEGAYAAKVTPDIVGRLEAYFGIPFPFEKLDVMAVPMMGGAMEHPGLVTFNAHLMLAREGEDTVRRQRGFSETQVHELAHQWFGNLVTMAWWDDLWLNEAFATWMTPRIVEDWQPAWDAPVQRVQDRSDALTDDGLVSARRIRQPVEAEGDAINAFDAITYGKGSAVLAMTEAWLGRDVFQRGIQRYLRAHAGGNATARDFLASLSAEAGADVGRVLSPFLDQGGAPLVTAELVCAPGKAPVVKLAQRRYLPVGSAGSAAQVWSVPLCLRYGTGASEARACTVLESAAAELPLPAGGGCPEWLYPNAEGAGYLRAQLVGPGADKLLTSTLPHLSRAERVALLGDAQALARAGTLPAAEALALAYRFAQDPDRQVLSAAMQLLFLVEPRLLPEGRQADRARFLRDTFGARALKLGLVPGPQEDEETRLLRPELVLAAGVGGQEAHLVGQARSLADRWLSDARLLPNEAVDTVLSIAASAGDAALHARMLEGLRKQTDRRVRRQLIFGLASFRDPALARQSLQLLLDPAMDAREVVMLLYISSGSFYVRDVAYAFVKENYDALLARLPEDFHASLSWVGGGYCDAERRADVAAFFAERSAKLPGGERMLAQALESVDLCIALKAAQGASIEAFLSRPPRPVAPRVEQGR
ncbi:M1 family metallopeptidase [Myxococcaceae bacterium GXIMD 01537]